MDKINTKVVNDRIIELIKALNMSEYAFTKQLGYSSNSTIQRITTGVNGKRALPGYETLMGIIKTFKVNPTWLMMGKGEMFLKNPHLIPHLIPHLNEVNGPPEYEKTITVAENGHQNIILIDQKAAAGYTQGIRDIDYVESLPAFNMPGLSNNSFRAFELSGDSMEPTMWQGDWLICQQLEALKDVREGYVHVVILQDGSIVAKRAVPESGGLLLKSDNRAYVPYKVKKEEIFEVWRAIRRVTSYLSAPQNLDVRLTSLEFAFKEVRDQFKVLLSREKKGD